MVNKLLLNAFKDRRNDKRTLGLVPPQPEEAFPVTLPDGWETANKPDENK